ncbi:DUF1858 domain-containing protein [Butyrivibrio sp. NC3005]|jgi:hybrid cluster-associated redox disulfide protein|uniref:DUF1858 domain-containing protein n=1 Tax=Butyrivibrio sp. NC3005 TaxID=1280685 RepID=UPI0004081700|nr:DUF1858 domain-containing protein [Butyrivibrio sp. NC3005]
MENKVTKEMLIGELVSKYPEAVDFLYDVGMHCIGCPSSQMESIAEAAMVHGLDGDMIVDALNEKLAEA